MSSERRYYDDAYTARFTSRVTARERRGDHEAIELESTYFYPESGGQESDRGTLGEAPVVDVQADESGRVWHLLAHPGPALDGPAEGVLDWARRFDHMQQHTGQHVLSAAFERVLDAPTVSSRLSERGTIEVELADVDWRSVERVEDAANAVVWEDREVLRHWVSEADLGRFDLRKAPPKDRAGAGGRIRIVEIPDWDASPCGGTHTRHTGEIGAIKVVRWERVRGHLRFEFHCGRRALRDHAWRTEALVEAARRRTLADRELLAHLERAVEERDELRKRVAEMSDRLLLAEARAAVAGGAPAALWHPARPRDEVRRLAIKCLEAGAPWVVAGAGAPEAVVVGGRAKALDLDLRALVPGLLERAGGRGGGSPDLVQAAARDATAAESAMSWLAGELAARTGRGPRPG